LVASLLLVAAVPSTNLSTQVRSILAHGSTEQPAYAATSAPTQSPQATAIGPSGLEPIVVGNARQIVPLARLGAVKFFRWHGRRMATGWLLQTALAL
jgi:hypothetical protein